MHRVFIAAFASLICWAQALAVQPDNIWLDQIQHALRNTLDAELDAMASSMGLNDYESRIQISYIDPRLKLAPCEHEPALKIPMPLKLGRVHIKISCDTPNRWAINVPVDLKMFSEVLVFSHPISKNTVINESDVNFFRTDISKLRNGYFIKENNVIGKQSKRAVAGKTIVTPHLLQPALMIKKGDSVIIQAKSGQMTVKMGGEALADGREGRQIRVRNDRSNRIVKARVKAPGIVQVDF